MIRLLACVVVIPLLAIAPVRDEPPVVTRPTIGCGGTVFTLTTGDNENLLGAASQSLTAKVAAERSPSACGNTSP